MPDDTVRAAAPAPATIKLLPVKDDGEFSALLDSDRFAQIQRVAKLFSESDLVPAVFQGKPANCAVALQMAFRMRVDPMMLMQNMYIIKGRPGIEAKLAIALMNSRGPFTGPLQWKLDGEGDSRSWTCYATHKETGERCEATVTWKMVHAEGWDAKDGSKWKTLPDLMGRYRSAMFLGRLYCPEVLLGLPTNEELTDIDGSERTVPGVRIEDPIELPTAIAQDQAAPTPPPPQEKAPPPIDVDPATGEVTQAPAEQAKAAMTPSSEAQRAMVTKVAGTAGISPGAVDGAMVDQFAFVLADMPAEMFATVLGHFKTLDAQRAK